MSRSKLTELNRRRFLQLAGAAAAAGMLPGCTNQAPTSAGRGRTSVALIYDPVDPVASSPAAQWALTHLGQTLESNGVTVGAVGSAGINILIAGGGGRGPESLSIHAHTEQDGTFQIDATAPDPRGLVYALTDLADRVNNSTDPGAALRSVRSIDEQPANRIRAISRLFVSDVEDKAWFNDRDFWHRYLTMLVTHRFNRFNLALGLGYDGPTGLRDSYFYFAYPFLLNVPGYSVRAVGLPDAERDSNLAMLKFISDQAVARGLDFQLGIWTHAYQWTNSPNVNYTIDGLTEETQAAYSRDALHRLLEACPGISGVTFRTHGESGVAEGNYDFWKTVFDGIVKTGRKINIDLHAKGMDQQMMDVALATGLPVTLSPKFWAEHMGLPYMPASIRQQEMPNPSRAGSGTFALSNGARSFLRYSFGDFIKSGRTYGILHRVWPGTQRLLLWGDAAYAAEYGRAFNFCGTDGVEFFEPLTFKGRKGSGLPGGRDGYADKSLRPERGAGGDFEKYQYTYRLWGRLTYNPDADADVWQRQLRHDLGPAAAPVQMALANSSRILPLITTAHDPAAANYDYWPEIYTNQSIFDPADPNPYREQRPPRIFTAVSSLDPQLFSTVSECADAILSGTRPAKYTPLDVAGYLQQWSDSAFDHLADAEKVYNRYDPVFRRAAIDARISAGIGRFFAWKFRAAVLFVMFDRTGDESAKQLALKYYRQARDAWSELAAAGSVYRDDLTFGSDAQVRRHWKDRLAAIDRDIAAMVGRHATATKKSVAPPLPVWSRGSIAISHDSPSNFTPGQPLDLEFSTPPIVSARLWYRHVNQGEIFQSVDLRKTGNLYQGQIPSNYTDSPFPLQYYVELQVAPGLNTLYPGFKPDFLGQPYFVVMQK